MPLSEHEQRLLEQMERALYAEDPKFASTMGGADIRRIYRRRLVLAAVAFVVGVVLLLAGPLTRLLPLSVVGFVVMLVAVLYAVTSRRRATISASQPRAVPLNAPRVRSRAKQRRSFMTRIEDRWNRRREAGGL